MAKPRTLVPQNGYRIGFIIVLLLASFFRLWHLTSLPPGLAPGEAQIGLAAYYLLHHGVWPNLSLATGGSPVLVLLEAINLWLFGHSLWILRLVPALLGIAAVGATFIWGRSWFGRRTGLLAAFLLAITPWSVTLSRNVEPAALAPLLLALILWLGTRLWHRRTIVEAVALAVVVLIAGLSGPVGWTILLAAGVMGLAVGISHKTRPNLQQMGLWIGLTVVATLPSLVIAVSGHGRGRAVFGSASLGQYLSGIGHTILAFQIHGDDNFLHNLGGEPLLNVFVGIMLISGILVALTRWRQRPYRALLLGFVAALIPTIMAPQTAPDAARLAVALPLALALASVGIGYMLEVWYVTFPINSAARLTGQLAILLLLALSVYQGYTQYFVAWSNSSETHRAYGDAALGVAAWISKLPAGTDALIVANGDDATIIRYRVSGNHPYEIVDPATLANALKQRPLHLVLTTTWRDQVVAELKTTAPGGTLEAQQSSFDGADLYYTYDLP
jgi:4-amino-4-deoxy-L-arabinose transferase-like glycosyltransferase